ncbi:MAG TPA: fumarylacetoacetate hydrolase family protein [Wenzhouxiangellaceae bacterium]|nr:fumarylacetoacetate hydrolase family protein [Wenzhouxiangellaceae bacterium]
MAILPDWQPAPLKLVDGRDFHVRHAWCVGRNYAEHAREMGSDPDKSEPVFFSKPAAAIVQADTIEWPPATEDLHHEAELVVFLGAGGRDLSPQQAADCVFGYAAGCDLTRRDVQGRAKAAGMPWALSKGFDQSGPVGLIVPADEWQPDDDRKIRLQVSGERRQQAVLGDMIWPVAELLSRLSREVTLHPGDGVFTGTPAGVAGLAVGDLVKVEIDGLSALNFEIVPRQ